MSEREAFLRAIIDDPTDDGVRLVFADWLDEQGENDRAELIRVQIAIAQARIGCTCGRCVPHGQHNNGPCAASQVRVKVGSLVIPAMHREAWLLDRLCFPLVVAGLTCVNRRGFVDEIRCTHNQWLTHGTAIVREHPVTRVVLTDREPFLSDGFSGEFFWQAGGRPDPTYMVHSSIWSFLTSGVLRGTLKYYPTRETAKDDLFAASIKWARGVNS